MNEMCQGFGEVYEEDFGLTPDPSPDGDGSWCGNISKWLSDWVFGFEREEDFFGSEY